MLLYFLRHGDASRDSSIDDSERPLTDLGARQAALAAAFLQRINPDIGAVLSSPLARARQTASIVGEKNALPAAIASEHLLNGSDQRQLFKQLESLGVQSALLVGHEPHLSETISMLLSGNREAGIEMKKCGIALVETPATIEAGSGRLRWLVSPDTIQQLA
jgi:phosphohistidine phosphatase